jgi:hypothetical protein
VAATGMRGTAREQPKKTGGPRRGWRSWAGAHTAGASHARQLPLLPCIALPLPAGPHTSAVSSARAKTRRPGEGPCMQPPPCCPPHPPPNTPTPPPPGRPAQAHRTAQEASPPFLGGGGAGLRPRPAPLCCSIAIAIAPHRASCEYVRRPISHQSSDKTRCNTSARCHLPGGGEGQSALVSGSLLLLMPCSATTA